MINYQPPPHDGLPIIHLDKTFLVVDKPSGLLSVPGRAETHKDCLQTRVQDEFPEALTVHRLDMDTSGLMIFARTAQAHKNLGQQFEHRKVSKTYIARIWGSIDHQDGLIDLPLRCDWPNRPRQMVCHEHGKPSQTHWRVLEKDSVASRVELKPITGRSHQLRVHMLSLGHPILGDNLYAHDAALHASDRLQLHAQDIAFHHPDHGEIISFSAPCQF